jgi:hypothetical protein
MKTKKSRTQPPNARHLGELDLARLFKVMVAERNTDRKKIPEFKELHTYSQFIRDYLTEMIKVALKKGEVKMYKGQKIVSDKFTSNNDVEWDLKYGLVDCNLYMNHRFKNIEVTFDPSFRQKHLERNRVK